MKKYFALILAVCLVGCTAKSDIEEDTALKFGDECISEAELSLMFRYMNEKDNEEMVPIYGTGYWEQVVDDCNNTYADNMHDYIFYQDVLNMLALSAEYDEEGMTSVDMDAVNKDSAECFGELAEITQDYSLQDVRDFMTYTRKAEAVQALVDIDDDISEEEYRVVSVYEAYFESENKAASFYRRINKGESFMSISNETETRAVSYSRDSDITDTYRDILFGLQEGESYGILETQGKYMVVYMSDTMNEELSAKHKAELLKAEKDAVWENICSTKIGSSDISLDKEFYDTLKFGYTDDTSVCKILDRYI